MTALDERAGTISVRTRREGLAARAGHDLVLVAERWTAEVAGGLAEARAVTLSVDPRSLGVREAVGGPKPLSEADREKLHATLRDRVLRGAPIRFRSTRVARDGNALEVEGELEIAGRARRMSTRLDVGRDGRVTGTIPVSLAAHGIEPPTALRGTLRVADVVEVAVDMRLPGG